MTMEQNKQNSRNNQLSCKVCKIYFISIADFALHEFSKKHCDNLIRLAKKKPVINKKKVKTKTCTTVKETPLVNTIAQTGSFSKYGYFIPEKIYKNPEASKEFNTEYDPYLQKFAKNPFAETGPYSKETVATNQILPVATNNIDFGKKKKKKIKTCQICNVTLNTIPDYEAHMKSPQHIWKLKVSGMGVTAHFVKATTDLHTINISKHSDLKNQKPSELAGEMEVTTNQPLSSFPALYCSDCELLFNSIHQYNAHFVEKSHIECIKKKTESKINKVETCNPSPDQLFCFSCNISLNNLFQYNEHKNGKKHRSRCQRLIKNGITIPPEEQVPGLPIQNTISNKPPVYPKLYKKTMMPNQKEAEQIVNLNSESLIQPTVPENLSTHCAPSVNISLGENSDFSQIYVCNICKLNFQSLSFYTTHCLSHDDNKSYSDQLVFSKEYKENFSYAYISNIIPEKNNNSEKSDVSLLENSNLISQNKSAETNSQEEKEIRDNLSISKVAFSDDALINSSGNQLLISSSNSMTLDTEDDKKKLVAEREFSNGFVVINYNEFLKCNVCIKEFHCQTEYHTHLNSEDHFKKILDLKNAGKTNAEILKVIFSDKNYLKRDKSGKLNCSFCNVTTNSDTEIEQHIESIYHKNALKDFYRKTTIEVNNIASANEAGLYTCKLCKEEWNNLVEFTQHLNFVKHKTIQSLRKAKKMLAEKRIGTLRKRKLIQTLKKNKYLIRSLKNGINPGIRTKLSGTPSDLNTGTQASSPNFEPLILKTNINIGVSQTLHPIKKMKKKSKINLNFELNRNLPVNKGNVYHKTTQPLIPPLLPNTPFQLRSQSLNPGNLSYFMPSRQSNLYPNPCFRPQPFLRRTPLIHNSYLDPPAHSWFPRPPFSRYC